MSQEENSLNQEPKKASGRSWVSLLLSGFLIIRGFMYISEGNTVWGSIMLLVGVGGIIWKLYEMNKQA